MTTVLPALSAEVMEALRPAFEAIEAQVRRAVLATEERTIRRKGEALVRSLGYDSDHQRGHDAIMRAVFGPEAQERWLARDRSSVVTLDEDDQDDPPDERTCTCDGCTFPTCQGDCDACDDPDCEQCHGDCDYDCYVCHDVRTCCGYCDRCNDHHDGYTEDRCDDCDHCRECNHYCA